MIERIHRLIQRFRERPEGPDALRAWTEKVKQHAWKCTDEDIAALKAAGCSEDEIYEATIAAAMSAAASRLERGLALVKR